MKMIKANKFLIKKYIDILKAMYVYGPRNLSEIARRLKTPKRTIHERFRKMKGEDFLKVHLNIDLHKIGMVNTILFIIPVLNKFDLAKKILLQHDFLHRMYLCLGEYTGFYTVFNLPVENITDFEDYLEYLLAKEIIESRMTYYAYDFTYVKLDFDYLDLNKYAWVIDIDKIFKDNAAKENFLPEEIDRFRVDVDQIDIYIISMLQEDATRKFSQIVSEQNLSRSLVKYHFDKHVKNIIKDYFFDLNPFSSDYVKLILRLQFSDKRGINNFIGKLIKTPLLRSYAIEFGGGNLFLEMRIPVDLLNIFEKILIRSNEFGVLNMNISILSKCYEDFRPIPVSLFDEDSNKWIFNNEKYLEMLR